MGLPLNQDPDGLQDTLEAAVLTPRERMIIAKALRWCARSYESRLNKLERKQLNAPGARRARQMRSYLSRLDEIFEVVDRIEGDAQ